MRGRKRTGKQISINGKGNVYCQYKGMAVSLKKCKECEHIFGVNNIFRYVLCKNGGVC